MSYLHSRILDYGLNALVHETTRLLVHTDEPTDYDVAIGSFIGEKISPVVAGPENATKGRRVSVSPIIDGHITTTGTANYWSLIDDNGKRLLVTDNLGIAFDTVKGNSFTMSGFSITMPGA